MAFRNSIDSHSVFDRFPNFSLEEIPNPLDRIQSLIARSKEHELVASRFYTVAGALEILHGADYHYNNLRRIKIGLDSLSDDRRIRYGNLQNETVAYINRVGQFFHFATSRPVADRIGEISQFAPTIETAVEFRNKYAAHRSIDKPLKEDTPYLQEQNAISLSGYGGWQWFPKPGKSPTQSPMICFEDHYFVSQIQKGRRQGGSFLQR